MRCQCVYREDAKGGAAKSVRDRFTAPLRSMYDASVFPTSRTVMLATHVVNHKSSEASATINCQLQAKRTWNYRLRRSRPGTFPFLVSERL